jgi:multimeric flavodoxin WrbA
MEILALLGSPRRLGNSELMAKEISRRIPPVKACPSS